MDFGCNTYKRVTLRKLGDTLSGFDVPDVCLRVYFEIVELYNVDRKPIHQ